ncbi:MAG: DoxX family protein [Bacteroidia bacterium]
MIEFEGTHAAYLIARLFLGILFFVQGYDKVFRVKVQNIYTTMLPSFNRLNMNPSLVKIMAYLTSYIEFTGGFLLILGLFTQLALIILGIDLLIVAIGLGMLTPMWDMQHAFPRLILLLVLLILPEYWNVFSLDELLKLNSK